MQKLDMDKNQCPHFKYDIGLATPIPNETFVFVTFQGNYRLAVIKAARLVPNSQEQVEYYIHYYGDNRRNDCWVH